MVRILFVCMGNICRSPAAQCVFQQKVDEAGLADEVYIDSAGTTGYHAGSPPDPRMQAALAQREVPVIGLARQVEAGDLEVFDLVLAMDGDNYRNLQSLARTDAQRAKIRRFTEFCSRHDAEAVPDPYYGGRRGFDRVLAIIEDGCSGLLEHIRTAADPA